MSNQRSRRRTEFETSRPAKNRKENERGGGMQQIKLSECKEGDKICLPSWQNGQKYRLVYWVGEPTSIVKYHTKVDEKGVKKRHKISIPAVWVSHLEKGEAKLIRKNVVDYEMVEVRQKWPTLDTQGNEVYVFLI